jgi:hypothetical protein
VPIVFHVPGTRGNSLFLSQWGTGLMFTDGRRRVAAIPYGDVIHNWPYASRKRAGDAESGWRPPPDKQTIYGLGYALRILVAQLEQRRGPRETAEPEATIRR